MELIRKHEIKIVDKNGNRVDSTAYIPEELYTCPSNYSGIVQDIRLKCYRVVLHLHNYIDCFNISCEGITSETEFIDHIKDRIGSYISTYYDIINKVSVNFSSKITGSIEIVDGRGCFEYEGYDITFEIFPIFHFVYLNSESVCYKGFDIFENHPNAPVACFVSELVTDSDVKDPYDSAISEKSNVDEALWFIDIMKMMRGY